VAGDYDPAAIPPGDRAESRDHPRSDHLPQYERGPLPGGSRARRCAVDTLPAVQRRLARNLPRHAARNQRLGRQPTWLFCRTVRDDASAATSHEWIIVVPRMCPSARQDAVTKGQ
jgi:hypothetical protein